MKQLLCCLSIFTLVVLGSSHQTPQTRRLKVVIVDEKNHSLDDVQPSDVQVWENGVRQDATVEKQQAPVRYALVVDTSGSLRSQFPSVVETARALVRMNNESDETTLIRFVDSSVIHAVQPFTADKQVLLSKIDRLVVQPGQTALVDAIHASLGYVNQVAEKEPDKNHALVLISDGENRKSNHSLEEVLKFTETKNIRIFTIGLTSELDSASFAIRPSKEKAEDLLQQLARRSGGRTFIIRKKDDFPRAVLEVVKDLRNYYAVSYTPSSNSKKTKIEVRVSKSADQKGRKAIFNSFVEK